ncbi:MAG: alpha/beta hydrolase, partial [Pseudomonadota bacterium]|nr:alpha/beta hydrolase [Pseudomonadota bacterium]
MSQKPLIHFAHANGFPVGCYRFFLDQLRDDYEILSIDKIGHNPNYPITNRWRYLVEEVHDNILAHQKRTQNFDPIIGLGHSLGAFLTLLCAHEYPQLFRQIIIIEPPMLVGWKAIGWRVLKSFGLQDYLSPAYASRKRRVIFESREQIREIYQNKRFFKYFHPECFNDYLNAAFVECPTGVRLAFEREYEVAIFRTVPDREHQFKKPTEMPGAFISGKYSDLNKWQMMNHAARYLSYLKQIE